MNLEPSSPYVVMRDDALDGIKRSLRTNLDCRGAVDCIDGYLATSKAWQTKLRRVHHNDTIYNKLIAIHEATGPNVCAKCCMPGSRPMGEHKERTAALSQP